MHAHPADATRTTMGLFFSSAGVDDPARIHLPFVPPASSTTRRTTSQGRLPNFQRFHLASPFRAAPEPASWSFARRHPPVSVRVNFQSAPECHAHRNGDPAEKKTPATGGGVLRGSARVSGRSLAGARGQPRPQGASGSMKSVPFGRARWQGDRSAPACGNAGRLSRRRGPVPEDRAGSAKACVPCPQPLRFRVDRTSGHPQLKTPALLLARAPSRRGRSVGPHAQRARICRL
jgi:hypothetical protein